MIRINGAAVAAGVVLLAAGCSSGASDEAAAPPAAATESASARAGAQEANSSDCPVKDSANQTVCMKITANTLRFSDANGGQDPVNWVYTSWKTGCSNTRPKDTHSDPDYATKGALNFTTNSSVRWYQTHLASDACPQVTYKGDGLPADASALVLYGINQNTGGNSSNCNGTSAYTYCNAVKPGSGNAEDYPFNLRNFPVTVAIQNSLDESVTLGSKALSAMVLDENYGKPGDSIGAGNSGTWGAYRQSSTASSMTLKYTVGGSSDYSGTVVQVQVQVDKNGSPTGSKCSVANKSQFNSVFCSVSTSPVVPTPTSGDASVSPDQQPPVTISVQIHK